MTAMEFVTSVIDALEKLHIPYMAVGSFSVNVYGKPRSTKDADFVIELGQTPVNSLSRELGDAFVLDPQMSFETITATSRYRLRHKESLFLIEIFLLSDDAHDRERFSRRVQGDIGGRRAFVPTAEDVVITKLRWSRQGQREKDSDDVLNVLRVQAGHLDLDYIRRWCDQHGTRSLFEQLLLESQRFEQEQP
jgi:hypothetical protein